jgi:hypothetical protein
MFFHEKVEHFQAGPIDIEVRVWHDDANGMQAEPLSYKIPDQPRIVVMNAASMVGPDAIIAALAREEYNENHLRYLMHEDDAFVHIPFDDHPVSISEFHEMRI